MNKDIKAKSSPRNKGRKDKNKSNSRKEYQYDEARLDSKGRDNDPNYYFTSAELAEQAAQLSFQDVLGAGTVVGDFENATISVVALNACPGISFQMDTPQAWTNPLNLTYPVPEFPNDGINLMATKLYTLLSTFSGRTSNYQPCDVAAMLLATASISELSEHIRRAFGVLMTYNPRNRTMPQRLIEAMGIDFGDFKANIADYRMRFNTIMSRINQIPLLDNIGYIRKSRELYQKVYMDDPSSMAQIFLFVPWSVWTLDEQSYSAGSVLVTTSAWAYNRNKPMSNYLTTLEQMVDAILSSSTLQIVYSDILNLANKMSVPTWQFDYLAENYVVMPEYNRTASLQYHHMTVCGAPMGDTRRDSSFKFKLDANSSWQHLTYTDEGGGTVKTYITNNNDVCCDVNSGNIIYNPVGLMGNGKANSNPVVVDMDTDKPAKEDIIEAMRYSVVWAGGAVEYTKTDNTTDKTTAFYTLSDHYCVELHFYPSDMTKEVYMNSGYVSTSSGPWVNSNGWAHHIGIIDKFKSHPILKVAGLLQDTQELIGDLNFYTSVDYRYLQRVNRLMFEGLFDFRVKGGKN